jgi:hypothetical protein
MYFVPDEMYFVPDEMYFVNITQRHSSGGYYWPANQGAPYKPAALPGWFSKLAPNNMASGWAAIIPTEH